MNSVLKKFEQLTGQKQQVFPHVITNDKTLKRLDRALENRSPFVISLIYKSAAKDENLKEMEEFINKELQQPREDLVEDDKALIDKIMQAYKPIKRKIVIFNSVGSLIYISEVLEEIRRNKNITRILLITCMLWLYQNCIEVVISHLAELFFMIAQDQKDIEFVRLYEKAVDKEEHLMFGQLRNYAIKKRWISAKGTSFLHDNKLRNKLAHANCYYDSVRDKIIIDSETVWNVDDFSKEFRQIRDSLFELVFQMNEQQEFRLKSELLRLSREYKKLGRDPQRSKFFKTKYEI